MTNSGGKITTVLDLSVTVEILCQTPTTTSRTHLVAITYESRVYVAGE